VAIRLVSICFDRRNGRRLNLVLDGVTSYAFVSGSAPPERTFDFSLESLSWVRNGLTYQAWGDGGYFVVNSQPDGIRIEFKSYNDVEASVCYLSRQEFVDGLRSLEKGSIEPSVNVA
jgi:hypothetical protein